MHEAEKKQRHRRKSRSADPSRASERVVAIASPRRPAAVARNSNQEVSDAEIAQLVSVALADALAALDKQDPNTCLRLRAYEARARMREIDFPQGRAKVTDEKVFNDYRKAIASQNLSLELALNLVSILQRFARISDREIPFNYA